MTIRRQVIEYQPVTAQPGEFCQTAIEISITCISVRGIHLAPKQAFLGNGRGAPSSLPESTTRAPGTRFSIGSAMTRHALGIWSDCAGRRGSLARPAVWWANPIEPVEAIDVPHVRPSGFVDRRDDLREDPHAAEGAVCRDLACDEPEASRRPE